MSIESYRKLVCGECDIGKTETVVGNGITESPYLQLIRCPYETEYYKYPDDECIHMERISMDEKLKCPFCGGDVRIVICDDEGNYPKDIEYAKDPYSGLGYILCHSTKDVIGDCPIAREPSYDMQGISIYDTREEAISAWNKRYVKE